jgi:hypothetical protein
MPRKPNYDQDKRRKELDRKNKKEAKRLDREQRRNERQGEPDPDAVPPVDEAPTS